MITGGTWGTMKVPLVALSGKPRAAMSSMMSLISKFVGASKNKNLNIL